MYLINNKTSNTAYIPSQAIRDRDFNSNEWREATDEEIEQIKTKEMPIELSESELNKSNLRQRREVECFAVLQRSEFFFCEATGQDKLELKAWYTAWLNVTTTLVVPVVPQYIVDRGGV